jgi:predicted MFS family arabinose efflux permease
MTRGLMALFAITLVVGAGTIHYQTPMLGAMAAEFGASPSEIGWVPTLTFGGFLVGIAFLAPLGDRFDKRRLILIHVGAVILALLCVAAAPSLPALVAASFALGVVGGFTQNILPLAAELSAPSERGRVMGTLLTTLFLGILCGRLAGGFIGGALGWRWMYVISACVLAALAVALIARLPSSPPKTALPYFRLLASIFDLLRQHADMRRVVATQFLLNICYGSLWATIAPMLSRVHGLGPQSAGLMALPGAAGILVARPAGRWMDRSGNAPVVLFGVCLVIAAWAVFALGQWWAAALVVGAILLDCGLRATMVANQTVMNTLAPEARSRANTLFGIHVWGGNAVGAFLASTAFAHGGWLAVCAIAATSACAALAVQKLARR